MVSLKDMDNGEIIRYDDTHVVGQGSTACVYRNEQDSDELIKVYNDPTIEDELRIKELVQRPTPHTAVAWPKRRLADLNGNFVGYSMKKLNGEASHFFIIAALRNKKQLLWDHWNRLTTTIETIRILKHLQDQFLLMQDLNPGNVLIEVNSDEVVEAVNVIDVPDSVQYLVRDRHANMVKKTPPYLADGCIPPEYLDVDVQKVGMTAEGLSFITFCFVYLCLKGISPFEYPCPSTPYNKRVKQGLYAFNPNLPSDARVQDCGIPWSELSQKLRRLCHRAATEKPGNRPSLDEWITVLQEERAQYKPAVVARLPRAAKSSSVSPSFLPASAVSILKKLTVFSRRYAHKIVAACLPFAYFAVLAISEFVTSVEPQDTPRPSAARIRQRPLQHEPYSPPAVNSHFNLGSPEWRESMKGLNP